MTSPWRNVSVNVVLSRKWNCLLISAPKVHWRVQVTAARLSGRFNKMHGALRTLHVSLNNASIRTVCKCLKRNNGHLITLQIRMERRYHIWGAMHEASLKLSSEAQNSFWIKNCTGEDIGHLQVVWQENLNCDGNHSKHLPLLKKSVRTYGICSALNSWDNFDNVSTAKLPWLKAA